MPTYNALDDPYLCGFFEKPYIQRHLKDMNLIKRRRKSASHTKRPSTTTGGYEMKAQRFKLPMIENGVESVKLNA